MTLRICYDCLKAQNVTSCVGEVRLTVDRCNWCEKVVPTADAAIYGLAEAKVHQLRADNVVIQG